MPLRKSSLKILRVCCFPPCPKDSWEAPLRPCSCLEHLAAPPIPPGWAVKVLLHQNPQLTWCGSPLMGHTFARARAVCHQVRQGGLGWILYTRGHAFWVWIWAWCYEVSDFFIVVKGGQLILVEGTGQRVVCSGPWGGSWWSKPISVRGYKSSKVLFLFINIPNQGNYGLLCRMAGPAEAEPGGTDTGGSSSLLPLLGSTSTSYYLWLLMWGKGERKTCLEMTWMSP